MTPSRIKITRDGDIQFIYADTLQPLYELGSTTIRRASHVEPTPDGQWSVDLAPSHGPTLGPFPTRTAALTAEIHWLLANWMGLPLPGHPRLHTHIGRWGVRSLTQR
jgi:hypothetical protein